MAATGTGVPQFASLYVGDLSPDVTEAMLYEIFNSVGPVASIRVCRDSVSRRSLGYGYINFHGVSDAERALDTLNYSTIRNRACRIMWSQRDPSLRKSGLGNIFVKNLDRNIDNKALYDTFSLFGNILSCKVATEKDGKPRGYGFVHYETAEAARQAIERVNGMQIGEKTVMVEGFQKRSDRERPTFENFTNIYIKNIPADWDEEKIQETFKVYGPITSFCLNTDKKSRRFAFLNFEKSEDAKSAIEAMHDKDLLTEEQKAALKEKAKENQDGEEDDKEKESEEQLLYVQRAQTKSERVIQLKEKMPPRENTAPARPTGVNLYVKNLDEHMDDSSLRALFERFGTITSVKAMQDEKGVCKGFGFVCFAIPDEATKAVTEMHLKVIKGKPLYVGLAEKREARQERLRSRYSTPAAFGKGEGGKGKGGGFGKGGGMPPSMYGGMGGMNPMYFQQQQMMQQQAMTRPQGMMGFPQQMMGGPMGKTGPRPGMPQNAGGQMMGKGGPMMGGPGGKGGAMGAGMGGMGPMGAMGPMGGMGPGMGCMGGMGGGMMGPPMQQMPQMMRPGMPQQMQQPQMQQQAPGALTAAGLSGQTPAAQKQVLGERLFPQIAKYQPELAGKITGMMLEMDNSELLMLIESPDQLKGKVDEAIRVLSSGGR
jgi:polyadenylate-binding protein